MATENQVSEVLMLEPDRLCAVVLFQAVSGFFPQARVYCEIEPAAAAVKLAERPIDLFIVGLRGFDLDVITLLGVWAEHNACRTRVLVVSPDGDSSAVTAIRGLPISGLFDPAHNDLRDFEMACRIIVSGGSYWSSHGSKNLRGPRRAAIGNYPREYGDECDFALRPRMHPPLSYRSRFRPPRFGM